MPKKTDHLKPTMWRKGQSGNPRGKKSLAPEAQGLPKFDKGSFGRLCWEALWRSDGEAKSILEDKEAPQIKKYLANMLIKGRIRGDVGTLDWLLQRSGLDPLAKSVDITSNGESILQNASDESRQELFLQILERSRMFQDPALRSEVLKRIGKQTIDVTPSTPQT